MRTWFLAIGLILALAAGQHPAFAAPATIDTSSSAQATANSAQRKTFFDTLNSRHWAFYYNGTAIEYSYSPDGTTWTSAGTLAYNTPSFSAVFKTIGGTSYVYVVAEANTYDIVLRRGVLDVSSVTFGAETTVFDGSSVSDKYLKPTLAISENNHVWVSAIEDYGAGLFARFRVAVRRSSNTATGDISAWNAEELIGKRIVQLQSAVIMPQNGDGMYLISTNDGSSVVGYAFDGASWSSASAGGDYTWFSFGQNGIDAEVRAMAVNGSDLYVGGGFYDAGGLSAADGIAKWDGNKWSALGSNGAGEGAVNGAVASITVDGSYVYVGGWFENVAGIAEADYLARWDGNSWSALGSNGAGDGALNSTPYAMVINGSEIYVAGQFSDAGGIATADAIAKWDGNNWSALGSDGAGNGALSFAANSIAISGSDIYVGGWFQDAAGIAEADYLAKWDGNSWSALGSNGAGDGALSSSVVDIVMSGSDLYVGGAFVNAAGVAEADYLAKWDGSNWSALGSNGAGDGAFNSNVLVLVLAGSNIYVGGDFSNGAGIADADKIAMWNGASWSALGTGIPGGGLVEAIAVSGTNVYVGGAFTVGTENYTAKWDGSNWGAIQSGGFSRKISAIGVSGTNVYVGGEFYNAAGIAEADHIAKWDGNSWSAMGSNGAGDGPLNSVVRAIAVSGSDVYVGGFFTDAGGVAACDRIARWNGTTWNALGTGLSNTVSAIAVSGGNVYAGGDFLNAGSANGDRIARWNGATWNALGTGLSSTVVSIAVSGTDVYAGGAFLNAGSANGDRIARWNGATWNALGAGLGNTVSAIGISGTDVYAGGSFVDAGGIAEADRIARWDGSAWSALGNGLNSGVTSIGISGSDVYVGGGFTDAGGIAEADRVAKWNGTTWSALGAGVTATVLTLAVGGTDVYVGGEFLSYPSSGRAGPLGVYSPVIASDADDTTEISAVSDSDGNVYLGYTDSTDQLRFRRYDDTGDTWGATVTLNAAVSSSPSISYRATGGRVTASWIESNDLKLAHALSPYTGADWSNGEALYDLGTNAAVTAVGYQEIGNLPLVWTNSAANPFNVLADEIDMIAGADVIVSSSQGSATPTSPISVTITFSKDVTGFVVGDITVGNGTAGNFASVNARTYTVDITPVAEGAVTVDIAASVAKDSFDLDNEAATQFSTDFDISDPTLVISSSEASPTNASPIAVTFEFNEDVTGFAVGDITVGNGTAGNFVAVDGNTYTVDITPTGQGTVTVDVAASSCEDAAGNDNDAATQFIITYDSVIPTVVISSSETSPTNASPIAVTFEFSQAVSGFVVGDITVGNGSAGNFVAVDGNTYTADITPTGQGAVTVDVAAAVAEDAAGNDSSAAAQFSITYDSVVPTAAITSTASSPTEASLIPIAIEFSENISGFAVGDIAVANGSVGNFAAATGNRYTANVSAAAGGNVTVTVAAAAVTDTAGNANPAAQFTIVYQPQEESDDSDGDGVGDDQEEDDGTNPDDPGSVVTELETQWCSDWNGYLGMYNINEYVNLSSSRRSVVTTLFDIDGAARSAFGFSVAGESQIDLLAHEMSGWKQQSYGMICSDVTNGQPGDVDGRMVYYKPNETGYDFAFALPYVAGLKGSQFVAFNNIQPSQESLDAGNLVGNWIQITNLEQGSQTGTLIFYGLDGTVIASEAIDIWPEARRDYSAHHLGAVHAGIVEWRPSDGDAKFVLRNTRYYYDNPEMRDSFDAAVLLDGMKGNGESLSVLLDTRQQVAILEISNVTGYPLDVLVKIYNAAGVVVMSELLDDLPRYATRHLVVNGLLNDELGSAAINGSAPGSVVAVAMHYGKANPTGPFTIGHSYGINAKQALGTVVNGSYNTFLGQDCELLLVNSSKDSVVSTVEMTRLDGLEVLANHLITTPGKGASSFDLCAAEEADQYGVVTVTAGARNAITPLIIRKGANGDYRFVTPVR